MERITDVFAGEPHTPYLDSTGKVEAILAGGFVPLDTKAGILVPCYVTGDHGRHRLSPMRLHPDGTLKSIALQYPMEVRTPAGRFRAELVTFYPSGAVRRVFPLNGRIGGYWTEKDEYSLAETLTIPTPVGEIRVKPLYLHFYETGELKSITFWPDERIQVATPQGVMTIRRGISFYKSGSLASVEPAEPATVPTPLGVVEAFDPDPQGMNGETNSLRFGEDGTLLSLDTVSAELLDTRRGRRFSPARVRSHCSDTDFVLKPMTLQFAGEGLEIFSGRERIDAMGLDESLRLVPLSAPAEEWVQPLCG